MQQIINQLGTGAIPADEEAWLIARGMKFAGYLQSSTGAPFLITSVHENPIERLQQRITQQYYESRGLPSQFRIPKTPTPTAIVLPVGA